MPLLLSIDVDQGVAAQPAHSGVVIPRRCAVATSIPFRYSAPVRWIHWLTVLLVATAYLTSESAEELGDGGGGQWHVFAGLALLGHVDLEQAELQAQLGEQFAATGRLRGEVEHRPRIAGQARW